MAGGWWLDVVPAVPCRDCPPQPDGSSALGWVLFGGGLLVAVTALVALLTMNRTPRSAATSSTAENPRDASAAAVRGLGSAAASGVICAVIGLVLAETALSQIRSHEKELRTDAELLASVSLDGPALCREAANGFEPPDPAAAARCSPSPRSYAQQASANGAGTLTVEFLFSAGFSANGEVTVHDKLNHRALCVRLPGTDIADPSRAAGASDPFSSPADIDVSPYIAPGACPDAPIGAS